MPRCRLLANGKNRHLLQYEERYRAMVDEAIAALQEPEQVQDFLAYDIIDNRLTWCFVDTAGKTRWAVLHGLSIAIGDCGAICPGRVGADTDCPEHPVAGE